MATTPLDDVELATAAGDARPLEEWLTTFPLALAVIDPFTHESAWLMRTVERIFEHFRGASCRVSWLVTAPAADANRFLGPYAEQFLTFVDPDRSVVRDLGLTTLPALVVIRQDQEVVARAEGWDPPAWRQAVDELTLITGWSRPPLPAPGDPVAYPGTPALPSR